MGVLAIFTYEFDSATLAFQEANCPLVTLSDYSTLTTVAVESAYVSPIDQQTLVQWRQNPKQWSAQWER
jgi:orotate phosphoribosyltransferase